MKVSIVVPVYGSPSSLHLLHKRIVNVMDANQWSYELILVNDACPMNSWQQISLLCESDLNVKGIDLSRNFGQHYAISAGLKIATGDVAIVMDCDLQDRPEEIPRLIKALDNTTDVALGRSSSRGESSWFTQFTSKLFYKVFAYLTEDSDTKFNASFIALSQKAYMALNQLDENKRLFLGLLRYIGFKYVFVDVLHDERNEGKSSYNFRSRLSMAFKGVTNSSTKLLRIGVFLGVISSLSSLLYGVYLSFDRLFWGTTIPGWTSSIVSTFFVGGILMVLIGILGLYIEVIFWEVKKRPVFIVREYKNVQDKLDVK